MSYLIPYSSYYADIALGRIPGYATIDKWGRNAAVGTSIEDIWSVGGSMTYQTSAQTLELDCPNAADDVSGTGAQTVTIEGLDGSFDFQSQTVNTNGGGVAALTGTWLRVHRAFVATAGTGEANAGLLTVQVASGGATLAQIAVGANQTQMTQYTVPNAKTMLITNWWSRMQSASPTSSEIDVTILQRPEGGVFREFDVGVHTKDESRDHDRTPPVPIAIAAKTDVVIRAIRTGGASDALVASGYQGILVDD